MIIYRVHRGSMTESIKTSKEYDSIDEMKLDIVKNWHNIFSVEDIVVDDDDFYDYRIDWEDCKDVSTKRIGKEVYSVPQCIGFMATKYK